MTELGRDHLLDDLLDIFLPDAADLQPKLMILL
jgi:hypothetical protein